jgi:hypothetical protein
MQDQNKNFSRQMIENDGDSIIKGSIQVVTPNEPKVNPQAGVMGTAVPSNLPTSQPAQQPTSPLGSAPTASTNKE